MAFRKLSKPGSKGRRKEIHYAEYYPEKAAAKPPLKFLIIAFILVLALGGMGTGIFFLSQGAKNSLSAPDDIKITFNSEFDFWVLVGWNESENAKSYQVDYIYELYPDTVKSVVISDNSYRIERKRGILKYRISARDKAGRLASSEWAQIYIPPLYLDQPRVNSILQNGNLNVSWANVSYTYFNNTKQVQLYEYVEEFYYFDDGEYVLEDTNRSSKITTLNYFIIENNSLDKFHQDGYAKIVFKVRALNYSRTLAGSYQNSPEELYDIYDINSSWGYAEYTL